MLNTKVIFLVSCLVAIAAATTPKLVGGKTEIHGAKKYMAEHLLKTALSKFNSSDKGSYTIVAIHKVHLQVVSGILYSFEVDLKTSNNVEKTCNISLWSQPWMTKGNELTIACPDEPIVRFTQEP